MQASRIVFGDSPKRFFIKMKETDRPPPPTHTTVQNLTNNNKETLYRKRKIQKLITYLICFAFSRASLGYFMAHCLISFSVSGSFLSFSHSGSRFVKNSNSFNGILGSLQTSSTNGVPENILNDSNTKLSLGTKRTHLNLYKRSLSIRLITIKLMF